MHLQHGLTALRTAAPYIQAYRKRVFVVKLGGQLCSPGRVLDNVVDQLALLAQLGIKLVVVHGGGEQVSALCQRLGITPNVFAGRRITDAATLEAVKMGLAGTVNTDVVAAFRRAGIAAVGVSGIDSGLVAAHKRPHQVVDDPGSGETRDVDFGYVGDVKQVNGTLLQHLLAEEFVPVVCSLAADENGQVLNINADTVAARIAVELGATKYFLVTTVDGVMLDVNDPSTLQTHLDLREVTALIDAGRISGGMLPKLAACGDALRGGVPRVHIVNGRAPDAILGEVFTNEGCGTLLVRSRNAEQPAVEHEAVHP